MPEKTVEIDGKRYLANQDGTPKKDKKGNTIPAPDEKPDNGKKQEDREGKINPRNADPEALAKVNPNVAKLMNDASTLQQQMEEKERVRKEEECKRAEAEGNFQKLYEGSQSETQQLRTQLTEHGNELTKKDRMLNEYVGTVKGVLGKLLRKGPAEKKALTPADYSPRKKFEYLIENADLLGIDVTLAKGSQVHGHSSKPALSEREQVQKEFDELYAKATLSAQEKKRMRELADKLKALKQPTV